MCRGTFGVRAWKPVYLPNLVYVRSKAVVDVLLPATVLVRPVKLSASRDSFIMSALYASSGAGGYSTKYGEVAAKWELAFVEICLTMALPRLTATHCLVAYEAQASKSTTPSGRS